MISINGTLLFQFLNFFVLVAILAKFAYKPMLKVLEERRNKISSDLNDAEQSRLAAEKLKADYEQQLQTAQRLSIRPLSRQKRKDRRNSMPSVRKLPAKRNWHTPKSSVNVKPLFAK